MELDNYNNNEEKTIVINYKIENIYYKSLSELVENFAAKMSKIIKEFKKMNISAPPPRRKIYF